MSRRAVWEVDEGPFAGRYVVAQWVERNACYVSDMREESRRLTGCSQVSARSLRGIAESANVTVYRTLSGARRALKRSTADDR